MLKKIISLLMSSVMAFTLFAGSASAASDATSRTVSIFQVQGSNVKMTKGAEKEFNAKADQKLYDGYTVSTGNDSYCYLKLDDGSLLKMNQRSSVKISKASAQKLSIAVLSGGLTVDAAPQSGDSTVEVSVGNSALGIRGTYFAAENAADKTAVFTMFEGSGIVDGRALPSGHMMNVYDQAADDQQPSPSEQSDEMIYELEPFEIGEDTSAFVLQTILEDVDRFVKNGAITKQDLPALEDLLRLKREEMLREGLSAVIAGKALYNELVGGSYYSGIWNTDTVTVDKSQLQEYLLWIYGIKRGVFVSEDGSDVDDGVHWVTPAVMNALNAAIWEAERILSTVTTIAQVEEASTALAMQALRFGGDAVLNIGTKPVPVNTDLLDAAIANAYNAKRGVFMGSAAGDVENGKPWVTLFDMLALNDAITTAETALNTSSLSEVASSAAMLNEAIDMFDEAIQTGTRPGTLDRDLLETALDAAYAAKSSSLIRTSGLNGAYIGAMNAVPFQTSGARIIISADGNDVDANKQWVTSAENAAINSAIADAEVSFSMAATAQDVMDAADTLVTAVQAFNAVKKSGKWLNRSALLTIIDSAYNAKSGIMISTNGSDVYAGTMWVAMEEMVALNTAIAEAEAAYITVTTQQAVAEASVRLNAAVTVFSAVKKQGSKALNLETLVYEELFYAIDDAVKALDKVDVEYFIDTNNGRDTNWRNFWVTQEAVDTLELALEAGYEAYAEATTQMELRAVIRNLNWETNLFNWSISQGKQPDPHDETDAKVWRNTRTEEEFSSLLNAISVAKNDDTLVLFGNAYVDYAAIADIVLNFIVNPDTTLELDGIGTIAFSGTFVNNGTVINNASFFVLAGGTFENNGLFNNEPAALVAISGAVNDEQTNTQHPAAAFSNNGTCNIKGGASLVVGGAFNNESGAEITVDGTLALNDAGSFVNDGLLTLNFTGMFIYSSANETVINNGAIVVLPHPFGDNFVIPSDMVLVGSDGAYVDVQNLDVGIGWSWDLSNFYDAGGDFLGTVIYYGKYIWDSTDAAKIGWHMQLDKTALEAAIMQAEAILPTMDPIDAMLLDMATDHAKTALASATRQGELDEALAILNLGFNSVLDKTALNAAMAQTMDVATTILQTDFDNPKVWQLIYAREAALLVGATATTQEQIDNAAHELNQLLVDLRVNLDTDALVDAIARAEAALPTIGIHGATFLIGAIEDAIVALYTAATQDEIEFAVEMIDVIIGMFTPPPAPPLNTSALEAAIAQAEIVLAGNQENPFVSILDDAIGLAKTALTTATTQAEIDEALSELNTAVWFFLP